MLITSRKDGERDDEDGEGAGARLLQERRRHPLEDEVQAEAERGGVGRLQLGDQQALAGGVVAKPHAGREHDPARLEPGRRALDLDRVGARHATAQGVVAPGQQLQAQVLLGQQVTKRERGLRSRHRPLAESNRAADRRGRVASGAGARAFVGGVVHDVVPAAVDAVAAAS